MSFNEKFTEYLKKKGINREEIIKEIEEELEKDKELFQKIDMETAIARKEFEEKGFVSVVSVWEKEKVGKWTELYSG